MLKDLQRMLVGRGSQGRYFSIRVLTVKTGSSKYQGKQEFRVQILIIINL